VSAIPATIVLALPSLNRGICAATSQTPANSTRRKPTSAPRSSRFREVWHARVFAWLHPVVSITFPGRLPVGRTDGQPGIDLLRAVHAVELAYLAEIERWQGTLAATGVEGLEADIVSSALLMATIIVVASPGTVVLYTLAVGSWAQVQV